MDGAPGQNESEAVRQYCCERPLERPKTDIKTAAASTVIFVAIAAILSFGATRLVFWLGVQFQIGWIAARPILSGALACALCFAACLLLTMKRALIGLVRLYQHYAPEGLRRKCILKPTCSEYMILAVEKYGVFCGVKKSVHRLLFTCRGWDYRVDEP
jgi:putative component of membrane protein insertase Oxa1/YidC/SpoIIIJ protein YidD